MNTIVMMPVNRCECDICHHKWLTLTLPAACPTCNSKRWNGEKKRGRPPKNTELEIATNPRPRRHKTTAKTLEEYESDWEKN